MESVSSNTEETLSYIKSSTPTKSLATYITTSATQEGVTQLKLRAIGAGAVNQMIKGVITSEGRLIEKGIRLSYKMSYQDVTLDEATVSAIQININFTNE